MNEAIANIRADLVRALAQGKYAKLQRDRAAGFNQAFAYANALRQLGAEAELPDGIAYATFSGAINDAREWLGNEADKILGRG